MKLGRVVALVANDSETDVTTVNRQVPARRPLGRVVAREVLAAEEHARQILARAAAEADAIVTRAEARAEGLGAELLASAQREAASAVAARELALAAREENALERDLDRVVALARVLAERLLGETLALEPDRVVALARQALAEARGARRITLAAHPDDVPLLENAVKNQLFAVPLSVVSDGTRRRGSLRLDTELGVLDAELAPELDRLAEKLRELVARG
jgi:flagellar biosynthesis/type III secretory pathway protein FliH